MNSFRIKCILATLYDVFGINAIMLSKINKRTANNYIRVINYHHSPLEDKDQFIKQIKWFSKHFEFCGIEELQSFFEGKKSFDSKPGMIVTFDDGYLDNYQVAHQYLSVHGIPAIYMVSAGLVGKKAVRDGVEEEYISSDQMKEMISQGATIGCHTFSHHRMNKSDTDEVLQHEIVDSQKELELLTGQPIDIFCWCGGEEETYTKEASDLIRSSGYKVAFQTNSAPILQDCDRYQIDRSNIEAGWSMPLVRFQLSGFIDNRLKEKRLRIHELTK